MDDWKNMLENLNKTKQSINEDLEALGDGLLENIDTEVSKLQDKADDILSKLEVWEIRLMD